MASRTPLPTAADAMAVLFRHAAEAEALEHRAAKAVTESLRIQLQTVSRWLARTWTERLGALTDQADPTKLIPVVTELRTKLAALGTDPTQGLLVWSRQALRLGVRQATAEVRSTRPLVRHPMLGQDTLLAAFQLAGRVTERLRKADVVLLVNQGTGYADVMQGVAAANLAVTDLDRAARWMTNREVNNGTYQVADVIDAGLLWVAERNACVHCLAYSGVLAEPGNAFPPDLTFGTTPLTPWPNGILDRPPLHVNCRCRITPWQGSGSGGTTFSLPDALKREAQRSITKGWSLPSESEAVRLKAADDLLKRGTDLPPSVQQVAERAIARGRFINRNVPVAK